MTPETKDIKNYLHLYVGCQFVLMVKGLNQHSQPMYFGVDALKATHSTGEDKITPIPMLRRLESITYDEDQVEFPKHNRGEFIDQHWYPEGFVWLLSKGFDLFGLIDAGLAVEKK